MSSAPNTPTTYYLDSPNVKQACEEDFKKIHKKCGPEERSGEKGKKEKVRPSIRKLLGKKYKEKGYGKVLSRGGTDNRSWMADNCDFLWIPPGPDSHQDFLKQINSLKGDLAEAVEGSLKKIAEEAKEKIRQEAFDLAKKKAAKAAAKAGGRWVVGAAGATVAGGGAVVTEGIATVWNLWDLAKTGYEVVTAGVDMARELDAIDEIFKEYRGIGDELARLGRQAREDPQRAVADFMTAAGRLNPCVRARRCSLVPKSQANHLGGGGCCPGQTGHHLIPDAAVKGAGCPDYDYSKAPTVCAEGTGNSHGGSHQMLHDKLDKRMSDFKQAKRQASMPYEDYRRHAIMTFYETFPESGCDRKCLKAQLDAHYKCAGKQLKAVSGKGGAGSHPGADAD